MIRRLYISLLIFSALGCSSGALGYTDPQLDYVDWSQPNAMEVAKQKQELRLRELQIEATQAEIKQTYNPTIYQQQTVITQGNGNVVTTVQGVGG